jgi:hypothetical protein
MSTFTWRVGTTGDWTTAADWVGGIVPDNTGTVLFPSGGATGFTAQIAAGEHETVNAMTFGGFSGTNPTLEIAGTLQFAGTNPAITYVQGRIQVDSTGLFEGAAAGGFFVGFSVSFVNAGTVRANGGAGTVLQILAQFTNTGTVLADNGILGLGGAGIGNLSGGTLTGGTWIAQGPTAGTFNQIRFGGTFDALLTTDAAVIILDGAASEIQGYSGGFQPIETQLQTIAATGTLQLLNNRGYTTTNTIQDAGLLNLQGGTLATGALTVASGGILSGFGTVTGAVTDQGMVFATGGVLNLAGGVAGTGVLSVASGSALILAGDAPASVVNNGTIYDTAGLLNIGTLTGTGMLVAQNGGTIEIGGAASQAIVFSGSNATVRLDAPGSYTGTLAGFGLGDALVLAGVTATAANITNNNTLAILNGGATVDTVVLSGNYAGAAFTVSQSGSLATIRNTGGAPARQDFQFTISVNDTASITVDDETKIVNDLSAAALDWAQYVTGYAPLRIQLNISNNPAPGSELANGGFTTSVATGQIVNGATIFIPSSLYALTTGSYIAGIASDIVINLPLVPGSLNSSGGLYVNPTPFAGNGTVPASQFDLLTVFRHEIAHGLGFSGFTDTTNGSLGSAATLFDTYIQQTVVSGTITAANFIGPNAEAAYGALLGTGIPTPVPLTLLNNGENFFHVANTATETLGADLLSGVGLPNGTFRGISAVDLAMMQDIGLPVTAPVVCFARGTLIGTPLGEVPVENLIVGQLVKTWGGKARPIVWVGTGKVLATRGRRNAATPVIVRKGALADNVPHADLKVTKAHAFLIGDVLIPAEFLVNHRTIEWDDRAQEVTLYHIELQSHDILVAHGAPAESYRDDGNRWLFQNANSGWDLPPQEPYAPVLTGGPIVDAAWHRLLKRAGRRPGLPLTQMHGMHLLADGKRLDAVSRHGGINVFRLPSAPRSLRLLSRAAAPQELGLERDPRVLGVAVHRIVARQGTRFRVMEAADTALVAGFHTFEPDGGIRWTDGDATVPAVLFEAMHGGFEVVVHIAYSAWYRDDRVAAA